MTDLIYGIGLVLFIEGALYAVFPGFVLRMIHTFAFQPPQSLRVGGLVALLIGAGLMWAVRTQM